MGGTPLHKVLVLGAGAQGNVVAGVLSKADDVNALVLADIDPERAGETAANLGSAKVRTGRVDAGDLDGTTLFLKSGGFDLVVNTALPEFIPRVMLAALRAGCHYLDLSSTRFYERRGLPIEQLEHAEEWNVSGRTALVNGGSGPGLTNVMAAEGVGRLDETPVAVGGVRVSPRDVLMKRLPRTIAPQRLLELVESGRLNSQSMVVCEVSGRKENRPARVTLWSESPDLRTASALVRGTSDVSLVTSVPAATFALMLLQIGRA